MFRVKDPRQSWGMAKEFILSCSGDSTKECLIEAWTAVGMAIGTADLHFTPFYALCILAFHLEFYRLIYFWPHSVPGIFCQFLPHFST